MSLFKTIFESKALGFSYGEYTLACFKYFLWVYVRGVLPLSIALCGADCSKTGYGWVKQVDLIQNPYKQREALAEQWWTFQLLFLCKIESSRATSMRRNVG